MKIPKIKQAKRGTFGYSTENSLWTTKTTAVQQFHYLQPPGTLPADSPLPTSHSQGHIRPFPSSYCLGYTRLNLYKYDSNLCTNEAEESVPLVRCLHCKSGIYFGLVFREGSLFQGYRYRRVLPCCVVSMDHIRYVYGHYNVWYTGSSENLVDLKLRPDTFNPETTNTHSTYTLISVHLL